MAEINHIPVLLNEVVEFLRPMPGFTVLDATGGGGGHSSEIMKRITPGGKLIVLDRDPEAIERLKVVLPGPGTDVLFVNENFRNIGKVLEDKGISGLDGAIFDLGVSSYQIDEGKRGFSFLKDGPLDMRFDENQSLTAYTVVNQYTESELTHILREYGEERYAHNVARAVCKARKNGKIKSTQELVSIIDDAIGGKYYNQKIHSSARSFQAIRIAVNDELAAVKEGIEGAMDRIVPGGRICVISFHSLEDRIVKNVFRDRYKRKEFDLCVKKPVCPGREEVLINPRARSAKLRAAEKKMEKI